MARGMCSGARHYAAGINGNYLELVIEVPARGNIYSSDASENYPLVSFEDAVTVMVTPGKIVATWKVGWFPFWLKCSTAPKLPSMRNMKIRRITNTL